MPVLPPSICMPPRLRMPATLPEAENNIRKAVRLDPKDINAHRLLAEILALEDKKNDATAEVEHVNQLTKDTPPEQPSK